MGTTDNTATHFGARIKRARTDAHLSVEKTRDRLMVTIPARYVPGTKTLHRIEAGEVHEEKVDGILIYGLAKVFGCRISDLSEEVAQEFDRLADLLGSALPWITTCPDDLSQVPYVTPCVGQLDLLAVA